MCAYKLALLAVLSLSLLPAATVTNVATCAGSSTSNSGSYALCSAGLDYAYAAGSATQSGSALVLSASTYSSYVPDPQAPMSEQVGASAYTTITDTLTSSGPLRTGYAEIIFSNLFIQQSTEDITHATLSVSLNGSVVYSCFVPGGGMSTCPTGTIMAPVELGVPFALQVDDSTYSPISSLSGGISSQISISLLEDDASTTANVAEILTAPEPGAVALMAVGLGVLIALSRRRRSY